MGPQLPFSLSHLMSETAVSYMILINPMGQTSPVEDVLLKALSG